MKSSKTFKKSEDLSKYIEDIWCILEIRINIQQVCDLIWGQTCYKRIKTPDKYTNVNEISRWINCFRKQIQNTQQWSLPFLSWSQHPLTCTQRFEEDTKIQILRISQISQYTEVKSEKILKKSKDLQGFHRYILKYPHNMNYTMHIPVTY